MEPKQELHWKVQVGFILLSVKLESSQAAYCLFWPPLEASLCENLES